MANKDDTAGDNLMLRFFRFSCLQGHRWDVEYGNSIEADITSNLCPVCGARSECRMPSDAADSTDVADEFPPAPSRLDGN